MAKTVTLQTLADNFSALGVPVLLADVKGELPVLSHVGGNNPKIVARAKELGLTDFQGQASPSVFWDVFGRMVILFARRFRKWDHCCLVACFLSTTPRKVC